MDFFQTLEQRQASFVDVFAESESESKRMKHFVSSFFSQPPAGGYKPLSLRQFSFETLELRQLSYVDVFAESESESNRMKHFVSSLFSQPTGDVLGTSILSYSSSLLLSTTLPVQQPDEQEPPLLLLTISAESRDPSLSSLPPPQHDLVPPSRPPSKPGKVVPIVSSLSRIMSVRATWEAALRSDLSARTVIKRRMASKQQQHVAVENEAFNKCEHLKGIFDFTGLMTPTDFPQSLRAMGLCQAFYNTQAGDVYGQAEGVVEASCDDVAAFVFDNESKCRDLRSNRTAFSSGDGNRQNSGSPMHNAERQDQMRTIANPNEHSRVVLRQKPAPKGAFFTGREFLNLTVWKRRSAYNIVIAIVPTEHADAPPSNDFVRAETLQYFELTEVRPGVTNVHTYFHSNLNGNLPPIITFHIVPKFAISNIAACILYFQHLIPLSEMTESQGRNLGDVLMETILAVQKRQKWNHRVQVVAEELDTFIGRNSALSEFNVLCPSFNSMLRAVLERRTSSPGVVKTSLADLSNSEAKRIGSFFAGETLLGLNSETAVDTWISSQHALLELDETCVWFRPFMCAVALRQFKTNNWGLKARVIFGAGLSMFVSSRGVISGTTPRTRIV